MRKFLLLGIIASFVGLIGVRLWWVFGLLGNDSADSPPDQVAVENFTGSNTEIMRPAFGAASGSAITDPIAVGSGLQQARVTIFLPAIYETSAMLALFSDFEDRYNINIDHTTYESMQQYSALLEEMQNENGTGENFADIMLVNAMRIPEIESIMQRREFDAPLARQFIPGAYSVLEEYSFGFIPVGIDPPITAIDMSLLESGLIGSTITPAALKTTVLNRSIIKNGVYRHFGVLRGLSESLLLSTRIEDNNPYSGYREILYALILAQQEETLQLGLQLAGEGLYTSWSDIFVENYIDSYAIAQPLCDELAHRCFLHNDRASVIPSLYSDRKRASSIEGVEPAILPLWGDVEPTLDSYAVGRITTANTENLADAGLFLDFYLNRCAEGNATDIGLLPPCMGALRAQLLAENLRIFLPYVDDIRLIQSGGFSLSDELLDPQFLSFVQGEISRDDYIGQDVNVTGS